MSSAHRWNTDEERGELFTKLCCEIRDDWGSDLKPWPQLLAVMLLSFELEDVPMYTHTLGELSAATRLSERGVVKARAKLEAAGRLLSSTAGGDATTYRLRFNS